MDEEHDDRHAAQAMRQSDQALDPADVASTANRSADDMAVDPAQLFRQAMEQTRMAMIITDPLVRDNPIVFVNQAFETMTGYPRDEIIGRNCRFLQGRETRQQDIDRIRRFLDAREVGVVQILNYRKDGTHFWNSLHVGPIFDEQGRLTHFFGSQWDVTELVEGRERDVLHRSVRNELLHRTNNLFGVIGALVRLTARSETDVDAFASKITSRVDALARAHRVSIGDEDAGTATDLHAMAEAIMRPYRLDEPWRFELGGPVVPLSPEMITPLGLSLHELATNAMKYGALGAEAGKVSIEWETRDDRLQLVWTEADGPLLDPRQDGRSQGTGSRLVNDVIRGLGGRVDMDWRETGLRVAIDLPLHTD